MNEPADHLDRAFEAYLSAQVPDPWPGPPAVRSAARRRLRWGSRAALAASVLLLLGLGWTVSGGLRPAAPPPWPGLLKDATASGEKLLKDAGPMPELPMP